MHGDLGGLIYLNSRERFGSGPVNTPRQREQALADAMAAFREAQHPETGEPLFEEIFGVASQFHCDPVERMWPDLVAIPAPGFHTRHKFDAAPQLLRRDPTLTATHRLEGVLMVQAPGVASGRSEGAELRDVAPTILQLLGLPVPSRMTGRVLREILSDNAPARPTEAIESPTVFQLAGITDADQVCVEARLRDLGYLD